MKEKETQNDFIWGYKLSCRTIQVVSKVLCLYLFSCYKSLFYLVNCSILHLPKLSSKIDSLLLIFLRTLYENIPLFFHLHGDMSLGACWPPARVVLVTIPGLIFFTIWECPLPYSWFESSFSWILCNLPLGLPFSFGWT